jgi:hypothetical protein
MRVALVALLLSLTVPAVAAPHGKHPSAKAKPTAHAHSDSLPSTRADAAMAGKALLVRDLPKNLGMSDRSKLEAAAAELKGERFASGVALYRAWANASPKQLLRDEASAVGLWVFREGVLARNEEFAAAVDRVRFFDERNIAIDDSLALLKGAVIAKKPVLLAKLVVLAPYARETHGDLKLERQVSHEAYESEIRDLEAKAEEARTEREKARAAFKALESKVTQQMQALTAIVKVSTDMRLSAGS